MKELEERLKTYEPLWGQWTVGDELYSGSGLRAFELKRSRGEEEVAAMVKVIEIKGSDEEAAKRLRCVMDSIQKTESLGDCPQVVTIKGDAVYSVADEAGNPVGWDVLVLGERLVSLGEELSRNREFTEEEVRRMGIDICRALAYAHRREVFHGSITQDCLYRRPAGGFYMISGFGGFENQNEESRTERELYMAPELMMGEAAAKESDMYSLGLILYRLLNENALPFTGDPVDVRERLLNGEAWSLPSKGTKNLKQAVMMACVYEADKRFYEASDFRLGLEQAGYGTGKSEKVAEFMLFNRPVDLRIVSGLCIASFLLGIVVAKFI